MFNFIDIPVYSCEWLCRNGHQWTALPGAYNAVKTALTVYIRHNYVYMIKTYIAGLTPSHFTVDIRYGFFSIKSAFLIAFRSRNGFLSHKWTCPSKGVTNILQKGTIWGTVRFILLFDGTLQCLNRTNQSGLSFWLQWKLHFLERQWC